VDGEDIRSSGLVNGRLAGVPLWCASGLIARRWIVPTCVWKLNTARMGVSVGRLSQDVLLEEFYRSESSETVRGERVRVFEVLPPVFNCSVLTFGVQ
jgi:hypothetical protein